MFKSSLDMQIGSEDGRTNTWIKMEASTSIFFIQNFKWLLSESFL